VPQLAGNPWGMAGAALLVGAAVMLFAAMVLGEDRPDWLWPAVGVGALLGGGLCLVALA
jgi:hypothetical protein